jgi:hypothetical protein
MAATVGFQRFRNEASAISWEDYSGNSWVSEISKRSQRAKLGRLRGFGRDWRDFETKPAR